MSDYVLQCGAAPTAGSKYLVWVDQVGAFLLSLKNEVAIGGPAIDGGAADISFLANLSRRHATIVRSGERYVLHAQAPSHVAGRPVHDRSDLTDGCEILLGGSVRLAFRQPSVMSGTARIDFLSDHRPARAVDAIILMDDTCLVGPGTDKHIRCRPGQSALLLYRRDGKLWCKSREDVFVDGQHAPEGAELRSGSVVTGNELRFRIEQIG
ncbi:MAG: hypothetical protein JSS02_13750 [Planctomycetes bacterium]|nr:hypothetical protein [Planctomycetota bacterium]